MSGKPILFLGSILAIDRGQVGPPDFPIRDVIDGRSVKKKNDAL